MKGQHLWIWALATLAAMAVGAYLIFQFLRPEPLPAGILYGNGHVEVTEIEVSSQVTGRVEESALVEGRQVQTGAVLVRIADEDLRAQLGEARAAADAVSAAVDGIKRRLTTARHHRTTAESEIKRYRQLRERGLVTPEALEQVENRVEEARSQVAALEAQIREGQAKLQAARSRVEVLELQLEKTRIHAPITGTVLTKAIEVGELATPGRLVTVLGDVSRPELRIFIPERHIGKVKLGDSARVRVDAFPQRYFPARVARVAPQAQFTPRDIHVPEERVRMVFGVTLAIENREGLLKPGMPADTWIRWKEDVTWPEDLTVPE